MNIIKQGDLSRVENRIKRFVCSACGCEWEADKTEYFYDWSTHDIPRVCQCPTCNRVCHDHVYEDGSLLRGTRLEMCRTCANWKKDTECLLTRCVNYDSCTSDGYILYKQCDRHELDEDF